MPATTSLPASSFEALKASLCSLKELSHRSRNRYPVHGGTALEKYLYGKSCLTINCLSTGSYSGECHLIVHRVPPGEDERCIDEVSPTYHRARRGGGKSKSDRMFVVRHLGDFPDKVAAGGRYWRSRIWLLAIDFPQQVDGKSSFLEPLPLSQDASQIIDVLRPWIVFIELPVPGNLGGDKLSAVEGMPEIQQGVSDEVPELDRGVFDPLHLVDLPAGFRVVLGHKGEGLILYVADEDIVRTLQCRSRPIDFILDRLESLHA